jgi:predicted transcriptional regulator
MFRIKDTSLGSKERTKIPSLIKREFKITLVNEIAAQSLSDSFLDLRNLIVANENMYPGIDKWFNKKVIPGLKTSERAAYVGYMDEKPVVSAVVRRGNHSKFCHLKINDKFQENNLGDIFFILMAFEVRDTAKEIHFTLPESLWEKKKAFFQSFGFIAAIPSGTQYRLFENELRCSASFSDVWSAVLEKLPKIANDFSIGEYTIQNNILMSVQPKYAKKILDGEKAVEIRRKFSIKWKGSKVNLYSSSPTKALVGEAIIDNIIVDKPQSIWENYNSNIGCTKDEFDKYTNSLKEIYAIFLNNIRIYKVNVPLTQVSHLLNKDLKPPQSYCNLKENKAWADAVSIAALLQSRFGNAKALSVY